MSLIKVEQPGFLTHIQDLGRYGYAHLGVSASGAADAVSLRLGNLLVGNPENAAALEMTLVGGTFEFESNAIIAITGSDFEPKLDGNSLPLYTTVDVKAGNKLQFSATKSGARCYLCVRGGIDCSPVLGSASTHLLTGLGGHEGHALKKDDTLSVKIAPSNKGFLHVRVSPDVLKQLHRGGAVRATLGPQAEYFSDDAHAAFFSTPYAVSEESNRMGLRLTGSALTRTIAGDILSEGVSLGAVQVPQNGQPIILFVEHQTAGGYAKIANVISADFHRLGQLRPRDEIRFEKISIEQAVALLREQEKLIGRQSLLPI